MTVTGQPNTHLNQHARMQSATASMPSNNQSAHSNSVHAVPNVHHDTPENERSSSPLPHDDDYDDEVEQPLGIFRGVRHGSCFST